MLDHKNERRERQSRTKQGARQMPDPIRPPQIQGFICKSSQDYPGECYWISEENEHGVAIYTYGDKYILRRFVRVMTEEEIQKHGSKAIALSEPFESLEAALLGYKLVTASAARST
jgi:hypothetical protein